MRSTALSSEDPEQTSADTDAADPTPAAATPPSDDDSVPAGTSKSRMPLFLTLAAVVVIIDQVSKWIAIDTLTGAAPIPIIGDFLSLTLVFNPGAAFGLGSGVTIVLTLVALIVCIVVARVARKLRDRTWTIALSLLLAGALGNLIDRLFREPGIFRGHVVDFINYNGWFVGNIADIALTVAAGMMIWRSWQGIGLDGTREVSESTSKS